MMFAFENLDVDDVEIDGPIFNAVISLLATVGEIDKDKRPILAQKIRASFIDARSRSLRATRTP